MLNSPRTFSRPRIRATAHPNPFFRWRNGLAPSWLGVWPSLRVIGVKGSESGFRLLQNIIEGTTMEQYAGIDVSLESASACVVDAAGRIVRETKLSCEPNVLITRFSQLGISMTRIGLEAGPLSQWLYAEMP